MTGAKCWWTPSWPWRKSWACARWPRAWKPTTKPSGWPGWAATNCRVISFPSLARHKTLKTGGGAGWQALPPALFPDLPPRELEEQILQIRRPVQRAQVAMLPQRLQQRLRVLGVVKHRLTADLHARGQGTQRGVFGHLDGPHAEHLHHIRLQVLGDQLARAAFRNLAAVVQHQQARAQALGLVHEVGGQQYGLALLQQQLQALPHQVVGSSSSSRRGLLTSARASDRRRFMPPDSSPGLASALWVRAANSSNWGTRSSITGPFSPK